MERLTEYFLSVDSARKVGEYLSTYHSHDDASCEVAAALLDLISNNVRAIVADYEENPEKE